MHDLQADSRRARAQRLLAGGSDERDVVEPGIGAWQLREDVHEHARGTGHACPDRDRVDADERAA